MSKGKGTPAPKHIIPKIFALKKKILDEAKKNGIEMSGRKAHLLASAHFGYLRGEDNDVSNNWKEGRRAVNPRFKS